MKGQLPSHARPGWLVLLQRLESGRRVRQRLGDSGLVRSSAFRTAESLRSEWVVRINGKLRARPAGTENPDLPTGEVEVGYHVRSLAETGVFRMKAIFGSQLASRMPGRQVTEGAIRCRALNIMTHLGMPDSYKVA